MLYVLRQQQHEGSFSRQKYSTLTSSASGAAAGAACSSIGVLVFMTIAATAGKLAFLCIVCIIVHTRMYIIVGYSLLHESTKSHCCCRARRSCRLCFDSQTEGFRRRIQ